MPGLPALLLVGPLPPPSGGMANQTRQLATLLGREQVAVTVVQTNAPYRPAWIGRLRGLRALGRLLPYLWRLWRESGRCDVVHVMANSGWAWHLFAAPAILIASWRGRPVVINYRGGLAPEFLAHQSRIVLPVLRRAQLLVVPSRFLAECFARYGITSRIIPNVVDLELFRPAPAGSAAAGPPHVVVARNLEQLYGIDTAIEALAILAAEFPQLRASIAGSGPERAALERLVDARALGGRVSFTGRLETTAMADLYRSADVVLNPSRADNTPNSILEALACAVPVVSTAVGGIPFLVEHGRTAWLVPSEDPRAMADGVAVVLRDRALRDRLRREGLALARSTAWDRTRGLWLGAYAALAAPRPGPGATP